MFRNGENILYFTFCVASTFSLELGPGTPVPYSAELKRMIINYIFDRPADTSGDAIVDFVTGRANTIPDPEDEFRRLNISILDTDGMNKISELAKQKYWEEHMKQIANNTKMKQIANNTKTRRLSDHTNLYQTFYVDNEESEWIKQRALDFMQQAVYITRYNLKRTKPLRKRYEDKYLFHIGTQFGMLMQMKIKIETMEEMLQQMDLYWLKFHWFLIIYTKVLQVHTDITMTVKKMFELYQVFKKRRNDPVFMYSYTNPLDL